MNEVELGYTYPQTWTQLDSSGASSTGQVTVGGLLTRVSCHDWTRNLSIVALRRISHAVPSSSEPWPSAVLGNWTAPGLEGINLNAWGGSHVLVV